MNIDSLKEFTSRLKKKRMPTDVVGLDLTGAGINAVRMRKSDTEISVIAIDTVATAAAGSDSAGDSEGEVTPLSLPPKLKARYAAFAALGETCIVKFLSFPGRFDEAAEAKVVENLGLDDPNKYRVSYKLVSDPQAKEAKVLAVALPEQEAAGIPLLLPTGLPAPYSLEIAGLATMTAFLHFLGDKAKEDAVGIIDFGTNVSSFALFNKGTIALVRRFNFGTSALLNKVRETLGVDIETAEGIIADGAFDISQAVSEVMEPIVKQVVVSRDFVERRENCRISKMYVSGALIVSRDAIEEIRSSMGLTVETWNPFEGLTMSSGALPENLAGQEWRFAAAVGACLATFEET
jgi:Tfp pilus assembly PilM family ATPase